MKTPPLSPELEALLAPHRAVQPLASSIESRALARAAAAWPEMGGARVFGRPRWVFAVAAGVTIALGAGTYAAARSWMGTMSFEEPARVASVRSPSAGEPPPTSMVGADDAAAPAAATVPRPRRTVAKPSAAIVRPTNAELQLLRAARQDVTHGDFSGALALVAEHVRRFRNGGLVEEREALRVKALAGLGRHEEAQRAAAQFRARFPNSVFLGTFERLKEANR